MDNNVDNLDPQIREELFPSVISHRLGNNVNSYPIDFASHAREKFALKQKRASELAFKDHQKFLKDLKNMLKKEDVEGIIRRQEREQDPQLASHPIHLEPNTPPNEPNFTNYFKEMNWHKLKQRVGTTKNREKRFADVSDFQTSDHSDEMSNQSDQTLRQFLENLYNQIKDWAESSNITDVWINDNYQEEGFIMRFEEDSEIDYTAIFCAIFGLLGTTVLFFYIRRFYLQTQKSQLESEIATDISKNMVGTFALFPNHDDELHQKLDSILSLF